LPNEENRSDCDQAFVRGRLEHLSLMALTAAIHAKPGKSTDRTLGCNESGCARGFCV
jgi:hypothetical protein